MPKKKKSPTANTPKVPKKNLGTMLRDQLKRTELDGSVSFSDNDLGEGFSLQQLLAGGEVRTNIPLQRFLLNLHLGGFFGRSKLDIPDNLQQFGAPPHNTEIFKGVSNIGAGVTMPSGNQFGVDFTPETDRITLRGKIPF